MILELGIMAWGCKKHTPRDSKMHVFVISYIVPNIVALFNTRLIPKMSTTCLGMHVAAQLGRAT